MKPFRHHATIIVVFIGLSGIPAYGRTEDAATEKIHTLFASGDTSLARWVPSVVYKNGPERAMGRVWEMISSADIALTNLECVVATTGNFADKGERRPFLYRAPPDMLDVLTLAGFDVAVAANNHSGDYGPDALMEELSLLEAVGIAAVGAGRNTTEAARPVYVRSGNVIVAFIGLETNFEKFGAQKNRAGNHYAREYSPAFRAVRRVVQEARQHAHLIVFTPHWGGNWTDAPTEKRRELARALIDAGVDAIIGHSSHLFHGVETYKGRPIVYDMGTFFFDTVAKMRMRLSAGFILEFDRRGFRRLIMRPVLLGSAVTVPAQGRRLDEIKQLLIRLSKELQPDLALRDNGNEIVLDLDPPTEGYPRNITPPREVHVTSQTRQLSEELRRRLPNVVLSSPPEWAQDFDDVDLDNGVAILGARNAEAVWPGRGFFVDVALLVPGPFRGGRWEASLRGVNQATGETFLWRHPVADGNWIPVKWQRDQVVVDHSLARPEAVAEGTYDLSWRFEDVETRRFSKPVDVTRGDDQGFVAIGTIEITRDGIPDGPAGVSWTGFRPGSEGFDEKSFRQAMAATQGLQRWIWIALGVGGGFVAMLVAVTVVIRRKRKKRT